MSNRTRNLTFVTAGWMTFVWITRIRNAADDATLSSTGRATAYLLSAACLAGAATLAIVAARRGPERLVVALVIPIVIAHGAIWIIRGTQILLGDRGVPFKVVHLLLGLVSVGLAVLVVRSTRRAPVLV